MTEKIKTFLSETSSFIGLRAPLGGVFAFSACSVHAVAHMLFDKAVHDTPLYWVAAALIELATAWLVGRILGQVRDVTRSIGRGWAKQDRRFAWFVLIVYTVLVLPSFITSVIANYIEFDEHGLLAFLFPVLTAACAVGAAMPGLIKARKTQKKKDTDAQDDARSVKAVAKSVQEMEIWRKALASSGSARATLEAIVASPDWTRASIAQDIGVTPQAVSQHLKALATSGLIDRSNGHVVLPDGVVELLKEESRREDMDV